jgi:hypothetical protein
LKDVVVGSNPASHKKKKKNGPCAGMTQFKTPDKKTKPAPPLAPIRISRAMERKIRKKLLEAKVKRNLQALYGEVEHLWPPPASDEEKTTD